MNPDAEDRNTPVEVRAPRGARTMHVLFADGHEGAYPHELLRGYCPCAQCQGHSGPIRFVAGGDLTLSDIDEVGNYALRLTWGDGHSSGLYSFNYLRRLCSCAACIGSEPADPTQRTFSR
jgi:prepilin-type processing-associated H-X9-DG protein